MHTNSRSISQLSNCQELFYVDNMANQDQEIPLQFSKHANMVYCNMMSSLINKMCFR